MLKEKNILIGVCGGIAAYKVCDLVSRLKKRNININIIMTKAATNFINPLTFQTLSLNRVVTDMFDEPPYGRVEHIALAQNSDLVLIAPATANIIGKIANGIADDMLTTTIMASKAPVIFAPSMNNIMYENSILQDNIQKLKNKGCLFIEPEEGRLACGDYGKGKLADPEFIEEYICYLLMSRKDLAGKTVIVTAGPTEESIDPVRFITNHSSGKMGYAIAEKAALRGAKVYLITGPTRLKPPIGVKAINVITAEEMFNKVMEYYNSADIIIKSAAVADYKPESYNKDKIKKKDDMVLKLVNNPDILYELGKKKGNKVLIGFAMETRDLVENAKVKLKKKNLDLIIANDIDTEGAGFAVDTNVVKIIDRNGCIDSIPKLSKLDLADIIIDKAIAVLGEN